MKNSRNALLMIILLSSFGMAKAQKFDFIQGGNKISVGDKANYLSVCCKRGNFFYVSHLNKEKNLLMLDKFSEANKNIFSKTIADNTNTDANHYRFLGFFPMKNHFIYLCANLDETAGKWTYTATKVSSEGEMGTPNTLGEVMFSGALERSPLLENQDMYSVAPDSNHFLMYSYKYDEKKAGKKAIYKFMEGNAEGKEIGSIDFVTTNSPNVELIKLCMDNTGKFCALANIKTDPKLEGKFYLVTGDPEGAVKAAVIQGDFSMASSEYYDMRISKKGDLLFTGLELTPIAGKGGELKNSFYYRFDEESGAALAKKPIAYTKEDLDKIEAGGGGGKNTIDHYVFNVVEGEDNDVVFIIETDKDDGDYSLNLTARHTGNIMVQHISQKGLSTWINYVEKKQDLVKKYAEYGSYSVFDFNEKIYILYNETPDVVSKMVKKGDFSLDGIGKERNLEKPVIMAGIVNKTDGSIAQKPLYMYGDNNSDCVFSPFASRQVLYNQLVFLSISKEKDQFVTGSFTAIKR